MRKVPRAKQTFLPTAKHRSLSPKQTFLPKRSKPNPNSKAKHHPLHVQIQPVRKELGI